MELFFYIFFIFLATKSTTQNSVYTDVIKVAAAEVTISPECQKQLQIMSNDGALMWRMVDASSKYPISGMSYGNNRDLGNYDECIDINYEAYEGTVKGKYCGLSVAVISILEPLPNPYNMVIEPKALVEMPNIQYNYDLPSLKRDLSLRVDDDIMNHITITTLSSCVPDQCTPQEVGHYFIWGDITIANYSIVNFADVLPCMTKDSYDTFRPGDIVFIAVLSLIGLAIVWSTGYDFVLMKLEKKPRHAILLAFSVISNGKKLIATNPNTGFNQVTCLAGLRFISMMWVIAGHGFVALEQAPLINYAPLTDYQDHIQFQYMLSAPIAVDTFFFLSGFVLTFGYLKAVAKIPTVKQVMGVPMMIVHRYLRLTPALAVLFFVAISIFRYTGTGPMWGMVSNVLSDQCTRHWWAFFLYVQNYVNPSDMCLNHTWYLSADMQMFILAPLVLIPIAYLIKIDKRVYAYALICVLTIISLVVPIIIRLNEDMILDDYETHGRFSDYLVGILLGVILRDPRWQKFPFSKLTNLAIWCCVLNISVFWLIYMHHIVRVYNHTPYVLFYVLYRPVWSLSLAWMIYSSHLGYGGFINWFLSLPILQIGARLSYCMYLLHAVIQFYYVGLIRTPYYYGDYTIFYVWCGHFIVTIILSAVWSLAFESPMIAIEKFIFGGGAKRPTKTQAQA